MDDFWRASVDWYHVSITISVLSWPLTVLEPL